MSKKSKAHQEMQELEADRLAFELAPAVTPQQWRILRRLGYKGTTPCSSPQAQWIIDRLRTQTDEIAQAV